MKQVEYDFKKATEILNGYNSPRELAYDLMTAALHLSITDPCVYEDNVLELQRVVTDVCHLLESIKER